VIIGHFAVGLAAKKISPRLSLATLFIACQLLDFIWPLAVILGLESVHINHSLPTYNGLDLLHVPYSHSLGMAFIWSLLFGVLVKVWRHSLKSAIVASVVVFSHWILDYLTHIPDLPLWFGETKVGLGLWKSAWATFLTEASLFTAGIFLYYQATYPFSRKRALVFATMIIVLFGFHLAHVFGPKPPETNSAILVAAPAFSMWIVVLWAYFADRKP